ncbi:MAG: GIY-YIG nuclease family protein [Bacteroidota bacterium]
MYKVYILFSEKFGTTYVGQTNNLENRIERHNKGIVISTRKYMPWRIIYFEEHKTRSEAMKREKFFKSGIGREAIKKI